MFSCVLTVYQVLSPSSVVFGGKFGCFSSTVTDLCVCVHVCVCVCECYDTTQYIALHVFNMQTLGDSVCPLYNTYGILCKSSASCRIVPAV